MTAKKVPAPKATTIGRYEVRAWTDEDIEKVRALLPKIANGRKTRYQKHKSGVRSQKPAKTRKKSRNGNGSAKPKT